MPELPEVETVRLQLLHKVLGRRIKKIEVFNPKTVANNTEFANQIKNKTISHIDRVGKLLIFNFKNEKNFFLLAHLKMTGQFLFVDKSKQVSGGGHLIQDANTKDLPNRHTRVAFHFVDGTSLFFNDMRKFGYIYTADAETVKKARGRFGQEPIHDNFDIENFTTGIKRRKTPIKAALLDQTFIAGLGNIYVDETLFLAGVRPDRKSHLVTKKEAEAIAKASGKVMKDSIAVGGTTFQHFKDTGGKNGNYTDYLKVFGKQNTPCPNCGTIIEKTRVAGRGTHFCPKCQK